MSDPSEKKDKTTVSAGGVNLTPRAIVAIVIGIAALIFVFSNTAEIELRFLWLELSAPGWVLLLVRRSAVSNSRPTYTTPPAHTFWTRPLRRLPARSICTTKMISCSTMPSGLPARPQSMS